MSARADAQPTGQNGCKSAIREPLEVLPPKAERSRQRCTREKKARRQAYLLQLHQRQLGVRVQIVVECDREGKAAKSWPFGDGLAQPSQRDHLVRSADMPELLAKPSGPDRRHEVNRGVSARIADPVVADHDTDARG